MKILKGVLNFISKKEVYGLVIIICVAYFIYNTICIVLEEVLNRGKSSYEKKKRNTVTQLFKNITKWIIIVLAIIAILSLYGVNVRAMLASVGIAATIIGLALQDTIKDIIGGVSIMTENYFVVGDIVEYNNFVGTIIEFSLKCTKIKNMNGDVMIVANRNIMEIKNLSQSEQVVVIKMQTHYDEPLAKVEKVITEKILPEFNKIPNVFPDSAEYWGVDNLADSAVVYMLVFKCQRENQWACKRAANRIVLDQCNKNKIKIPFPQMEVHNGK